MNPTFPPVKQKLRKFKTNVSVKIKEEVTKQLDAKVIRVTRYPMWLANVMPVPKKDSKTRVCVDYRDLNKASLKDDFPLPNIHILINNCAKHEIGPFVDCYVGYRQILMDDKDAEKMAFITPWGIYCYRIMPFGLKNAEETYMRAMTTIFHDMIHKEIEVSMISLAGKNMPSITSSRNSHLMRTAIKAQALADHLAENTVDEEYEPLKTYFPDEEVMHIDEVEKEEKPGWKLFFYGTTNMKGIGIGAVLISEIGHHYPVTAQLRFYCTNNMAEYETCILEFRHIPRIHNEVADALATLELMLHHPDKAYVDPLHIQVHDRHAYYNMIEEELDGEPWFHDIREYIRMGVYPVHATGDQKITIRRLASGFFFSGGVLYKRTPDLGLLRCIDARHALTIMTEVHSGFCGLHMSGYVLAKKIL
ncbi:uncharacterized protein [Nicotiana sylvestris]|uniref:uncharacterized protein n=1 Tax=Nicotiana sylvestris TaxID=4096 RepID=UPI00388CB7FD